MKKYLFSLMFILSITANSQADWREDFEIFIEENQEFVGAVFSEIGSGVKNIPLVVLDKIKDLQVLDTKSKKTTLFAAVITAVASGLFIASAK